MLMTWPRCAIATPRCLLVSGVTSAQQCSVGLLEVKALECDLALRPDRTVLQ